MSKRDIFTSAEQVASWGQFEQCTPEEIQQRSIHIRQVVPREFLAISGDFGENLKQGDDAPALHAVVWRTDGSKSTLGDEIGDLSSDRAVILNFGSYT